jgi:hypothetical protein
MFTFPDAYILSLSEMLLFYFLLLVSTCRINLRLITIFTFDFFLRVNRLFVRYSRGFVILSL